MEGRMLDVLWHRLSMCCLASTSGHFKMYLSVQFYSDIEKLQTKKKQSVSNTLEQEKKKAMSLIWMPKQMDRCWPSESGFTLHQNSYKAGTLLISGWWWLLVTVSQTHFLNWSGPAGSHIIHVESLSIGPVKVTRGLCLTQKSLSLTLCSVNVLFLGGFFGQTWVVLLFSLTSADRVDFSLG